MDFPHDIRVYNKEPIGGGCKAPRESFDFRPLFQAMGDFIGGVGG